MRAVLRLLVLLGLIVLVSVGAVWLADRPGTVAIEWLGRRIDSSVSVLAGGVLVFALAVVALIQSALLIGRAPRLLARRRRLRRQQRAEQALVKGLVAVAAGDARDAKRHALRVETLSGDGPLALMLAAQAAQLNGDLDSAERAYELMRQQEAVRFLGLRGLIVLARRRGDTERALALADEAQAVRPGAPWIAGELFGLQAAAGDWQQAEQTLATAVKRKLIGSTEGRRHKAVVLLGRAAQEEAADNLREALGFAENAQRQAPHFAPAIMTAARLLARSDRRRKAEKLIEQAWAAEPLPPLAEAYRDLAGPEDGARIGERLEQLARHNPHHLESRLLVAEAALARRDWTTARAALTAARDQEEPDRRVLEALARLELAEKGDERAAQRWHEAAAATPPPARWSCQACGHVPAAWTPHCPACQSFDSLDWRRPHRTTSPSVPLPTAPADGTLAD